jgi:hypothetical protein
MAKHRFTKIKGTKDFLVVAVVCVFLCLWSIRDAWFPTQKILKKHPQTYSVTSKISGVVQSVPVKADQKIGGMVVLVELAPSSYQKAVTAAEEAYKAAKESGAPDKTQKLTALHKAKASLLACTIRNTDFTLETTHGEEALKGQVLEILARPATQVDVGDVLMTVQPHDTFYIFNKTLATLTFFGTFIALFFHRVASK